MASLILGYAQPGGLTDIEAAAPELVLMLGADEMPADRLKRAYKVYIGHHGDNGARQADLVLPGAAYAEKHGTYVNTEGRVQRGEKAAFPPAKYAFWTKTSPPERSPKLRVSPPSSSRSMN